MSIIVTYDLDQKWSEVKSAALHNGFDDFIYADDGRVFHLPNTTLKYNGDDRFAAVEKFRSVVEYVSPLIKMRVAAFEWGQARLYTNKK